MPEMVEPLRQRTDRDCFRTCMAMLTGYDYEVLPKITTIQWSEWAPAGGGTFIVSLNWEARRKLDHWKCENGELLLGLPFTTVATIYRRFFGLQLKLRRRQPSGPSICISPKYTHAIVDEGNGMIVDPMYGWHSTDAKFYLDTNRVWITVEQIV